MRAFTSAVHYDADPDVARASLEQFLRANGWGHLTVGITVDGPIDNRVSKSEPLMHRAWVGVARVCNRP